MIAQRQMVVWEQAQKQAVEAPSRIAELEGRAALV
jgi:hypothetical protein